jgi:DNA-nicking Smr family endonuclease
MKRRQSAPPRRGLSRDERELWASVTRAITPLGSPRPEPDGSRCAAAVAAPALERPKPPEKPAAPLAGLDRRLRQRLARGRVEIDADIDLHGRTQAAAHRALVDFLRTARADGARIVLVITGKGAPGSDGAPRSFDRERGVLRRQVPLWLQSPDLREVVLGFETAAPRHGGAGAFYVRLRRPRAEMP